MSQYDNLLGRPFKHGSTDCFGLMRDFYNQNFNLGIPNYARPENWWDLGLDLYTGYFRDHGFIPFTGHPREYLPGDGVLMAVRSKTINHAGVFVEGGKMLHHFVGRMSMVEDYRSLWRNTTVMIVRNKDVHVEPPKPQLVDFKEFLPHAVRSKLASAPVQPGPAQP